MNEKSFLLQTQFHPRPALVKDRRPSPCAVVIFGGTGDLARRKLVPALYNLALSDSLAQRFTLIGAARTCGDDKELQALWRASTDEHSRQKPVRDEVWESFAGDAMAVAGEFDDPELYTRLREALAKADARGAGGNRLFYFAVPASQFPVILKQLSNAGLTHQHVHGQEEGPWSRVIIEKPFGRDLESARALNRLALSVLDEDQIYRIDHYLGKETVQNILVVRFGNTIFEPLFNRNHIDHVEITMSEAIGVEGRGGFYEETGVMRDIVQNHLLQVLALCTMEPPVSFDADEIRNMKSQALRSLRRFEAHEIQDFIVRGQYEEYRSEPGVAPDSCTPTYVALRAFIDNWRWQGVPFYLRAGKAMKARMTEVSFHFRNIPMCLFGDDQTCHLVDPNVLRVRIQPNEGIALKMATKVPGENLAIGSVEMAFQYAEAFEKTPPWAYERLLLDCMRGDATLFARKDEVESSWDFIMPILDAWDAASFTTIPTYPLGSAGPGEADALLNEHGHRWTELKG